MNHTPLAIHNPALLPADVLLREFTARRALLETLLRLVRDNGPGKPLQHVVLIGARGMGKTTTLWAVAHSIVGDQELARLWQPVVFDEESRRIGDLADFWLEAIRQSELAVHSSEGKAEGLLARPGTDLEARAREAFLNVVSRSGKRVVLCIDNINDVFASIREPEQLHRLRAFLMEDDRVMAIGSATRHFDAIVGLDEPFFDFFRVFELAPLTLDDMKTTLLTLAQRRGDARVDSAIRERLGTIRSLHVLTGGNPRLIKTFYRLLAEGIVGDVRHDLERLVDEFTPYFKAILDALPTQQQRIVDAVALAWDPVEVATVAHATRIPSNQASAQLRNLVRAGIVVEAVGTPKRKTYLLADRFSNIHYLMRHGRAARQRFDWFVLTLRALFPDPEQAEAVARVANLTACSGEDGARDARDLLAAALARAENDYSRRQILHATIKEAWGHESLAKFEEWLHVEQTTHQLPSAGAELTVVAFCSRMPTELLQRLGYRPDDAEWWDRLASVLEGKEAWTIAELAWQEAINHDRENPSRWHSLGNLLAYHLGRPADGVAAFREAIRLDPTTAWTWSCMGTLLQRPLGRIDEAEVAIRKAIELDANLAWAWIELGDLLLEDRNDPVEAEAAYRRATEIDPQSPWAWYGLGELLGSDFNRLVEAEAAYRKAVELQPQYAVLWVTLGRLLEQRLHRLVDAEAAYHTATEMEPSSGLGWSDLGHLFASQQGRESDAVDAYRKAIELDPEHAYSHACLAQLLARTPGMDEEARSAAATGFALAPNNEFARHVFQEQCLDDAGSWQVVLPPTAKWCSTHRGDTAVFDFVFDGFIRYARLTSPRAAGQLLEGVPDRLPFEILSDAFRAHADRDVLHRLAPERRVSVQEVLDRITAES